MKARSILGALALIALFAGNVVLPACSGQGSFSGGGGNNSGTGTNPTPTPVPSNPQTQPFAVKGQVTYYDSSGNLLTSGSVMPPDVRIVITFNNNIDANSVLVNSTPQYSSVILTLTDGTGQQIAMPDLNVVADSNKLTISANGSGFYSGTTYTLQINSNLLDAYGQHLTTPVNANFMASGPKLGSEVDFTFDYDFGSTPATNPTTSFTVSYDTQSHQPSGPGSLSSPYPYGPFTMSVSPQVTTSMTGFVSFTAVYKMTLLPGVTYYFALKACQQSGSCSGYSAEATAGL